ncbi:hypothetical protein WJX84_011577 [Apatococcus fuscideae]|uniref:Uncharacterized protein n=1 Tax=Apatococcus fuscideae TaxID=2026836 RepID=A0AAW1TI84_9CHLO
MYQNTVSRSCEGCRTLQQASTLQHPDNPAGIAQAIDRPGAPGHGIIFPYDLYVKLLSLRESYRHRSFKRWRVA